MNKKEDNGYEAIGKFVVNFSNLTYTLSLCIQKLVEKDGELIKFIIKDEKIKQIAKRGFIIDVKKVKELGNDLMDILTAGEIYKLLKSILIEKYCNNIAFLKVLDSLFIQIGKFCNHDGLRNDLMHSGIIINADKIGKIGISKRILKDGELIHKKIEVDLDEVNKEVYLVAVNIYGLSKILHENGKIEDHFILQNGKPIFRDTIKPFISKKGKI